MKEAYVHIPEKTKSKRKKKTECPSTGVRNVEASDNATSLTSAHGDGFGTINFSKDTERAARQAGTLFAVYCGLTIVD